MQTIIFIGIQGSGKSTFYKEHFFNSHVRISLDLLKTRNREQKFLDVAYQTQSKVVIDNTNPTKAERKRYIDLATAHKHEVVGYFFRSALEEALARNNQRTGKAKIPEIGLRSCFSKLEMPSLEEGFHQLHYVQIIDNQFTISPWRDEI